MVGEVPVCMCVERGKVGSSLNPDNAPLVYGLYLEAALLWRGVKS